MWILLLVFINTSGVTSTQSIVFGDHTSCQIMGAQTSRAFSETEKDARLIWGCSPYVQHDNKGGM